ncbi:tRNA (adenosine(37)-N6)-dimethylallyltransferase MiaA [Paenibacillus sp. J22TS3]|uniref:tRNA (adenosine(37)-N6)-dimethylallyltransferase MiaA n=1 Tax=Paenibacillus sp. J22TS3 TaxID=2807192 RepID=UPI001B051550|nr:tRNA (adenosine(37)-N6)-dimethylallyltransferase MiaA [Paenibacillus sp. J22TS3]GIP19956.1 tRNA dimethylallyltransferase [Paenibacillus sp. J22TS3]
MTTAKKPKLLVLVGPTAVGKTRMSIELAHLFNCEIISGDSMQVYRGMDIGTAKITEAEMDGVPHHLIDVLDPHEPFSVALFQDYCSQLIPEITSRGHLPFIVGGTGLYVESVCYEFKFTDAPADEDFRNEQFKFAEEHGAEALHDRLKAVDPESAARLHPNDQRRIVRALEIFHLTGQTLSSQLASQKKQSPYDLCIIGLTMDRQLLYNRIEARIDEMMNQGLLAEVESLLKKGYSRGLVAMQGLGYKEMMEHLEDGVPLEEAVIKLKRDTRRYAKRQLSWFRHMRDIHWVDMTHPENYPENLAKVRAIIAGKFLTDLEYTSEH